MDKNRYLDLREKLVMLKMSIKKSVKKNDAMSIDKK